MTKLSMPRLAVLASATTGTPTAVATQAPGEAAAALHHARGLIADGILEPVSSRPLRVRVAENTFARALHGLVVNSPHLRRVITGSGLAVLTALAEGPKPIVAIAEATRLHINTVRNVVRVLRDRALLARRDDERIELATHAEPLRVLGVLHARHLVERKVARLLGPITVRRLGTASIVETPTANPEHPLTAVSRFQADGADVVAARYQYKIQPFGEQPIPLHEALLDAEYIQTPPRTLQAMRAHLARAP